MLCILTIGDPVNCTYIDGARIKYSVITLIYESLK